MNPQNGRAYLTAFTMIELIVVIGIIALLIIVFPWGPGTVAKEKSGRVACMSRQKQNLQELTGFADAHGDKFPSAISVTNGGAMEPMAKGDVVPCYLTFTNGYRNSYSFLCPSDKSRLPVEPGQSLTRTNVSYFISLDATLSGSPASSILTGDRHLQTSGKSVAPGLFTLSTNNNLGWTSDLHGINNRASGGVVGLVDGHVEWVSLSNLGKIVGRQTMPANRIVVP